MFSVYQWTTKASGNWLHWYKRLCEYESDLRSNEHYFSSSENMKIQACTGFEPMTFAIPVQRSINWTNKPTGSWLLC